MPKISNALTSPLDAFRQSIESARVVEPKPEEVRAAIKLLVHTLTVMAEKGLNHDMTPTMLFTGNESRMYSQMCEYLQKMDEGLKAAAAQTLELATELYGQALPELDQ